MTSIKEARGALTQFISSIDGGCVGQRWGYHESGCGDDETQTRLIAGLEVAIRADQSEAVRALIEAVQAVRKSFEYYSIIEHWDDDGYQGDKNGYDEYTAMMRPLWLALDATLTPFLSTEESQ